MTGHPRGLDRDSHSGPSSSAYTNTGILYTLRQSSTQPDSPDFGAFTQSYRRAGPVKSCRHGDAQQQWRRRSAERAANAYTETKSPHATAILVQQQRCGAKLCVIVIAPHFCSERTVCAVRALEPEQTRAERRPEPVGQRPQSWLDPQVGLSLPRSIDRSRTSHHARPFVLHAL